MSVANGQPFEATECDNCGEPVYHFGDLDHVVHYCGHRQEVA